MKKGLIIAIILAVIAAAGSVWYYYAHPKTQPEEDTIIEQQNL